MPWHLLGSWLVRGPLLLVAGAGARQFEDRNSYKVLDASIVCFGGENRWSWQVVCRSEAERVGLVRFLTFAARVDGTQLEGEYFSQVLSRCLYALAWHRVFSLCDLFRADAARCLSFLSAPRCA